MFPSRRPGQLAFLVLFHSLLFFSLQVHAAPVNATGKPTSVTTVHTTDTALGLMTETCVIVLTPIKDAQGNDAVQEVKTCSVTMQPSGSSTTSTASSTTSISASSSTSISGASSTSASSSAISSASSAARSQATSTAATSTVAETTAASSATSSSSGGIVVIVTSASSTTSASIPPTVTGSVPIVVIGTSDVPAATTSPIATTAAPDVTAAPNATAAPDVASSASSAAASGSAAAVEASPSPSAAAAFQLPGKKLSVLPIGLGVFAGISVIALIVVGLVTYERTKYRKAFRQRKLAESGATMGYGGNAV
ncbi:hypothetical protein CVT25_013065 [Psilocybe cyanescens]|uniref:Mid2 domain-containing protein n=1 Tax=Psilocybe cyanescens TaxID=93625 RepID=A0A409XSE6_PSICY|nr:hypothetical protein CVT25_013065 [Psilocybe cyanescens]